MMNNPISFAIQSLADGDLNKAAQELSLSLINQGSSLFKSTGIEMKSLLAEKLEKLDGIVRFIGFNGFLENVKIIKPI